MQFLFLKQRRFVGQKDQVAAPLEIRTDDGHFPKNLFPLGFIPHCFKGVSQLCQQLDARRRLTLDDIVKPVLLGDMRLTRLERVLCPEQGVVVLKRILHVLQFLQYLQQLRHIFRPEHMAAAHRRAGQTQAAVQPDRPGFRLPHDLQRDWLR